MADIEMVIKIPGSLYANLSKINHETVAGKRILECVKKGTQLPKGHGDLVDLGKMCDDYWDGNYMEIHKDDLPNIPIIIKAYKESEQMVYIKEYSIISEEGENFTGCDRCVNFEDSEEVCKARLCVHAIHELNDCYKERKQESEPSETSDEDSMSDEVFEKWVHSFKPKGAGK